MLDTTLKQIIDLLFQKSNDKIYAIRWTYTLGGNNTFFYINRITSSNFFIVDENIESRDMRIPCPFIF